jgi:hypothetical protein
MSVNHKLALRTAGLVPSPYTESGKHQDDVVVADAEVMASNLQLTSAGGRA